MRRSVTLVPVLALLFLGAPTAQASLTTVWHRTIGAAANDVAVGPGGAVYVVGQGALDPSGDRYAMITRFSPSGDVAWTRTWQFHPERPRAFIENANAVTVADNGVVYVTGSVIRHNCEGGGWFVHAYGPNGRLLHTYGTVHRWTCHIGPQYANDVAVDGSLVVVAGSDYGCCGDAGLSDGAVWAFDRNLDRRWRVDFEPPAPADPAWYDDTKTIAIGTGGAIYASGWAAIDAGIEGVRGPVGSLLVMRLNPTGAVVWSRRPGVPMGGGGAVASTADGDALLVAASTREGGTWLARLRSDGSPIWHRTWGADPTIKGGPSGLAIDAFGRTWLAGTRRDLSDNGTNPFVRTYGPTGRLLSSLVLDVTARSARGTGVATLGRAGFVGGTAHAGRVWRLRT